MKGLALLSLITLWSVSWTGTEAIDRLPGTVVPEVYNIHVEPIFEDYTFKGNVTIEIRAVEDTKMIFLHQKSLKIKNVTLRGVAQQWDTLNEAELLIIVVDQALKAGEKYNLTIVYEGVLGTTKYGFYRTRYFDGTEHKYIALTHFQPSGARRAFPCWDEPNFKAVFDISITHLNNYTDVLSNMPITNQKTSGDTTTTYFDRTMKMSTYLVAFIVSDFAYVPHDDDRIRVYTKPNSVIHTDFAWNFSEKALQVMDEYTGVSYFKYMPKIYHVAVVDLYPSAMENWGLVTFKEKKLLYKAGITSSERKENIARTIAHEIAHQWFGNLVSPEWWDYVWLNEGFAYYFEVYILDKIEPTWRVRDMFTVDSIQATSFVTDEKINTLPISRHLASKNELMSVFDSVSYVKAACIIRMFAHILTEEVFRNGLKTYLEQYKFSVANSTGLLNLLHDAYGHEKTFGGRNFVQVANDWISLPGFPLVTVTRVAPGNYTLSQERFTAEGKYYDRTRWWIPITYATNTDMDFANTTVTHWLTSRNLTIVEPDAVWIVVNKQQLGYYRVNYDQETWRNISSALRSDRHQIHPINRAQLLDDVFTMAGNTIIDYETALNLSLYLNQETDYIPWMTAFKKLDTLRIMILRNLGTQNYPLFKDYIRYLLQGLTSEIGYEDSTLDVRPKKVLRAQAMNWACLADVPECLDTAERHFNAWLNDPHYKIEPDLRDAIICNGVRTATKESWKRAREILEKGQFVWVEKVNPLQALGCSNDPEILKEFLLNATEADSQIEFSSAVKGVLSNTNTSGVDIVLDVFENHFDKIVNMRYFGIDMVFAMPHIASAIVNTDQLTKLSLFVTQTRALPSDTLTGLQMANSNILWIREYGDRIDKWLAQNEATFTSADTCFADEC